MYFLEKGESIVIWGCGQQGKKFIEQYRDFYNIEFCVDSSINPQEEKRFEGYKVLHPSVLKGVKKKVIITVYEWESVVGQAMEEYDYKLFENIFPYTYITRDNMIVSLDMGFLSLIKSEEQRMQLISDFSRGRRVCVTYGLCHMRVYKTILAENNEFKQRYMLLDIPPINAREDKNYYLLKEDIVWKVSDVLICGVLNKAINVQGNFPGVAEVMGKLKKDCKVVRVSSAAFKGYFPQQAENRSDRKDKNGIAVKKYFAWGDKNINRLYKQGKSAEEIKQIILSDNFYDEERCIKFFENELALLEKEEADCNVKIADYIRKNAKQKITHFSFTHPIPEIMLELARRLLRELGIESNCLDKYINQNFLWLDSNEEIIYPSVLKALDLKQEIYINRKVKPGQMLFHGEKLSNEEYVEKYIEYVCKCEMIGQAI